MIGGRPGGTMPAGPDERAQNRNAVLRRLLPYLRPYRGVLLGILALSLVSATVQGAGPALVARAIDVDIGARDEAGLARTMLLLLAVYVGGLIASTVQIRLMSRVGQRFLAALRAQIFNKVQQLPLAFFDRNRAGDLMSRLVNDIQTLNQLISQGLVQALGSIFALVGIIIGMFVLSVPLALVSLLIVPVMVWTTVYFARRSRQAFRETRTAIGAVSSELEEDLGGVRVAQAFNRTEENIRRFAVANAANRDANIQATAVTSAFMPAIDTLSNVALVIVALFGGWLAVNGRIEVGTVVAFFLYVQQFFRPIQMLSSIATQVQSALAGAERIFSLVDEPVTQQDAPNAQALSSIAGRVVFEDVSFSYDARPATNDRERQGNKETNRSTASNGHSSPPLSSSLVPALILDHINLTAEPGQTVALVGPTGAGKTTLVNLIPRFYDVSAGRVTVDGHDVRDVTLKSLREQLGLVLQESFLFSGTIADNIRYGRLDASDEDIVAAAQAASADEFIQRLPDGYATQLGERGGGLSQGQRQLLAIARAVLADPRILILDEATSSIDTRTEALIQAALAKLLEGRTAFVIAHRLSTVRDADVVLVLDHGRIVERGTHDALLAQNGLYAELYRRQFRDLVEETI